MKAGMAWFLACELLFLPWGLCQSFVPHETENLTPDQVPSTNSWLFCLFSKQPSTLPSATNSLSAAPIPTEITEWADIDRTLDGCYAVLTPNYETAKRVCSAARTDDLLFRGAIPVGWWEESTQYSPIPPPKREEELNGSCQIEGTNVVCRILNTGTNICFADASPTVSGLDIVAPSIISFADGTNSIVGDVQYMRRSFTRTAWPHGKRVFPRSFEIYKILFPSNPTDHQTTSATFVLSIPELENAQNPVSIEVRCSLITLRPQPHHGLGAGLRFSSGVSELRFGCVHPSDYERR